MKRNKLLALALALMLGVAAGGCGMKERPIPMESPDAFLQRLAASPYQESGTGAPLTGPGLSDPWGLGVDRARFENQNLYPAPESGEVVRLVDHGGNGTDKRDDTLALIAAIEAAREISASGKPVILDLPAGELDFIEGMNPVDPAYGIVISGIDNLTVRGAHTTLYFHGTFKPISVADCKNFRMTGVNIDFGRVPFSMGKIAATDGQTFDIEVDEGYPVDENTEIMGLLEYNPRTNAPLAGGNDIYYTVESVRLLGPQKLRIRFTSKYKASPAGTTVILRHQIYAYDAITADRCQNLFFENVNVYAAPGMAFLGRQNDNLYFNRFNVMLKPGTDRLMSVTADAIHLMETAGEVKVTNSLFENCGDDALNLHGFYQTVKEITGGRKTVRAVNERNYNFMPSPGDKLAVCNRNDLTEKGVYTVASARPASGGGFEITFTEAIGDAAAAGDMLVNLSRAATLTFENNIVRNKRCRGILVQSAAGGVVANNTFANLTDAGVLLTSDTSEWYEAMPTSDLVIRSNKFIGTNLCGGARAAITAYCYGPDGSEGKLGIMKNITIENNLIANTGSGGVMLCAVEGAVLSHNAVTTVGLLGRNNVGLIMRKSAGVRVEKNQLVAASSDFKPGMAEDCADGAITVADNDGVELADFVISASATTTEVGKISSGAVTVGDRSLSEWENLGTEIPLPGASNNEQEDVTVDEADFEANLVRFAWSDDGVYIAYDVSDDRLSWVPNSYWNGDGVEIFMTQNTEYGNSTEALKATDPTCIQLFMGAETSGGCQVVGARTSIEVMDRKEDIAMSFWVKEDNSGYCGEVFIPFSVVPAFKEKIDADGEISLCIRFGDSDADGGSLVQISNAASPVELNKYVPRRMPKIRFTQGGAKA